MILFPVAGPYALGMDTTEARRARLGQTIRRLRAEAGISQRALALMTGTSKTYVWMLENGRANATVGVLCRVADALGVRVADLFEF